MPIKKVAIDRIYQILQQEFKQNKMPVIDLIEAQGGSPYSILVATIMSARTKDETTATAYTRLQKEAPDLDALASLPVEKIEKLIFPVGFYKVKAKNLKKLPEVVKTRFKGVIPDTVEELCELPGVGRKTANLVVALAFHKPAICVDIHVHRINNRLGYLKTKDPLQTEMALRKKLAKKYWITINAYMVSFGQNTCRPVKPLCSECPISDYCNRIGVTKSR